jgi:IS5 family transposase
MEADQSALDFASSYYYKSLNSLNPVDGRLALLIHSDRRMSAQRKKLQKKRWFRNAQKWRTGCEGRISLLRRRHGLNRCHYKGMPGIKRWVGFGVIADNLINIGHVLAASTEA